MAATPTRVVIVDDSPIVRRVLRRLLEIDPAFSVVGEGENGADAMRLAMHLRPDLLLIDLNMPGGDGMTAVENIMARAPTRIVVITSVVRYGKQAVLHSAIERGALELFAKTDVLAANDGAVFRNRLATLALARLPQLAEAVPVVDPHAATREAGDIVIIGASTGGPRAFRRVLSALPASFPLPIVIGQHMTSEFGDSFIDWLTGNTALSVREAEAGVLPRAGEVHVMIRGGNLGFSSTRHLMPLPNDGSPHCPALDPLFASAANIFGARATGVLLTGMGDDGARGLAAMHARGALTVAESAASAIVDGMPRAARDAKAARYVWSLDELVAWLSGIRRSHG